MGDRDEDVEILAGVALPEGLNRQLGQIQRAPRFADLGVTSVSVGAPAVR
ncbi:hypothetical protein HD597_004403 [Nonomuraea thailandensis]|uniref:Uncharacterized protein n=1 Tax=Nonomuraea thailandensis TaxID=1188745 RepID=A0A9X2K1W1_9ACTN|nr:hypothetical protein [Nonomuraea thailandensis]MCP2357383.1 hypothetical protein [Nonomuraea thailandensis]